MKVKINDKKVVFEDKANVKDAYNSSPIIKLKKVLPEKQNSVIEVIEESNDIYDMLNKKKNYNNNNETNNTNNNKNAVNSSFSPVFRRNGSNAKRNDNINEAKSKLDILSFNKTNKLLKDFQFNDSEDVNMLIESFQKDFEETNYVNKSCLEVFYKKYHKINDYERKGKLNKISPSFKFIKASKQNRIIPNPVGLLKKDGENNKVQLNGLRMGSKYLKSIQNSLKFSSNINELYLSNNRLDNHTVKDFFNSLKELIDNKNSTKIKTIDLSYNKLNVYALDSLNMFISIDNCCLENINIQGNSIGDVMANKIVNSISTNISYCVQYLNLSNNNITDESSESIANLISSCSKLKVLNLNENLIKNKGAASILNKIKKHVNIKVLDIGWNLIGNNLNYNKNKKELMSLYNSKLPKVTNNLDSKVQNKKTNNNKNNNGINNNVNVESIFNNAELEDAKFIKGGDINKSKLLTNINSSYMANNISDFLKTQSFIKNMDLSCVSEFAMELSDLFCHNDCKLIHLDISFNNINYEDSLLISKAVVNNHTILGIHLDGNQMNIDCLGFIHAFYKNSVKSNYYANSIINNNMIVANTIIDDYNQYKFNSSDNNAQTSDATTFRQTNYSNFSNVLETERLTSKASINNNCLNLNTMLNDIRYKNNCWICEGWREMKFIYKPKFDIDFKDVNDSDANNNDVKDYKIENNNYSNNDYNSNKKIESLDNNLIFDNNNNNGANSIAEIINNNNIIIDSNNTNIFNEEKETNILSTKHQKRLMTSQHENSEVSFANIDKKDLDVKFHFSIDNYEPSASFLNVDNFYCYKVCKPGTLRYYYTINGEPVTHYGYKTIYLDEAIVQTYSKDKEFLDDITAKKQYIVNKVAEMNVKTSIKNSSSYGTIIDKDLNVLLKKCYPRPVVDIKAKQRQRDPWKFKDSIWKYYNYIYEGIDEDIEKNAFEFDFERSRVYNEREFKNDDEKEAVKAVLKNNYHNIYNLYKYLSSKEGMNLFQISQTGINEFASLACNLIEKTYTNNNLYIKAGESINIDKEERKKNKLLPDNLVRHQFMNFLVKVAKDKYYNKLQQFSTAGEAVLYAFENDYISCFETGNTHQWRIDKYYNEYVDNVLKSHFPVFEALFMSFAIKEVGKKVYEMDLNQFNIFCNSIIDSDFSVKFIPIIFCQSIKIQIDEINKDKHLKMHFEEFLEGMSRVIDKLSPIGDDDDSEEWDYQMKQEQHLSQKIANVLPKFLDVLKPQFKNIKERFELPKKDDCGYYEFNVDNNFYQNYPKNLSK